MVFVIVSVLHITDVSSIHVSLIMTELSAEGSSGVPKGGQRGQVPPLGGAPRGLTKMNTEFVGRKWQAYQLNCS